MTLAAQQRLIPVRLFRGIADAVGVILFSLLFFVFVVQIVARFGFNQPLPWTDEAASVLYIWSVLWGAALVCREREHVSFELLYLAAPLPVRRFMAMLSSALIVGFVAWALPASLDYIYFMRRESSAVLGLPLHLVFFPFALLLLTLLLRYAWRLALLCRRDWAQHL
ncbi:MAG: TRAP transporter small permease subunit [Hylemonella sp.]|nr:TRAP transporter small permease subunit [Hylemonella sp.]